MNKIKQIKAILLSAPYATAQQYGGTIALSRQDTGSVAWSRLHWTTD
ncbi:MAG: hypothetical protein AB2L24_26610 [Mangrovibacterium sp.]